MRAALEAWESNCMINELGNRSDVSDMWLQEPGRLRSSMAGIRKAIMGGSPGPEALSMSPRAPSSPSVSISVDDDSLVRSSSPTKVHLLPLLVLLVILLLLLLPLPLPSFFLLPSLDTCADHASAFFRCTSVPPFLADHASSSLSSGECFVMQPSPHQVPRCRGPRCGGLSRSSAAPTRSCPPSPPSCVLLTTLCRVVDIVSLSLLKCGFSSSRCTFHYLCGSVSKLMVSPRSPLTRPPTGPCRCCSGTWS